MSWIRNTEKNKKTTRKMAVYDQVADQNPHLSGLDPKFILKTINLKNDFLYEKCYKNTASRYRLILIRKKQNNQIVFCWKRSAESGSTPNECGIAMTMKYTNWILRAQLKLLTQVAFQSFTRLAPDGVGHYIWNRIYNYNLSKYLINLMHT